MTDEFKVDFIGIGVPRAGTTWIFQCLGEHPQICGSARKETKFFSDERLYNQGLSYYRQQFNGCKNDQKKGEFSPAYLYSAKAAERIKENFPEARFIVCFRNPIERAHSYFHFRQSKKLNKKIFESAIVDPKNNYVEHGFYFKYLKNYLALFRKEQFLFVFYEDIIKNPKQFMKNIYSFVGVDSDFVAPSLDKKINRNVTGRYKSNIFNTVTKKILSSKSRTYQFLRRLNTKTNPTPIDLPDISIKTKERLGNIFAGDIQRLEDFLGRDLSFWKK